MVRLPYPPKIDLARIPTTLTPLSRLSRELGVTLLCKRDDLTGAVLSGNKVRKLEFLFHEARSLGFQGVITCGGEQSNHARATAVAAAQLGFKCHLLLRTAQPTTPPPPSANILLDRLVGARIRWITPEDYAQRDALMAAQAVRLAQTNGATSYYVIPEGGSNAVGAWGYVRCAQELAEQLGPVSATVVYAVGSGGTAAGLIAGCRLLNLPYTLIGVCVCNNRTYFQNRIAAILSEMNEQFSLDLSIAPEEITIWEDYVGLGYALSRPAELACIQRIARLEGLITDPVYSGKAFFGLLSELQHGRQLASPIVFIHTGGIFGLFPKAEQLSQF